MWDNPEEKFDEVCKLIATGHSIKSIGKMENMPGESTIYTWMFDNPAFQAKYACAREIQADIMAEEILEISDDATNDWMEKFGKEGESIGYALNGEHVQRSTLRVNSRKWLASKLQPKKYGDRQAVDHSGQVSIAQLVEASMLPREEK